MTRFHIDPAALRHARKAIDRLASAGRRLEAAKSLDDVEEAWEDYLNRAHRVYEKLKAGCRGNGPAWGWYGRIQDERRDDPLLAYVHHARNSDHHRFEEVVVKRPPGMEFQFTGNMMIDELVLTPNGAFGKWEGAPIIQRRLPERLDVLPVTDSGVRYEVPTMHEGQPVIEPSVTHIARLAFAYLKKLVEIAGVLSSADTP